MCCPDDIYCINETHVLLILLVLGHSVRVWEGGTILCVFMSLCVTGHVCLCECVSVRVCVCVEGGSLCECVWPNLPRVCDRLVDCSLTPGLF